jgi:hypothetical protein
MQPNASILKLWTAFLVLGIIVFVLQIYHISLQLKNKSYLQNIEGQEKDILKKLS